MDKIEKMMKVLEERRKECEAILVEQMNVMSANAKNEGVEYIHNFRRECEYYLERMKIYNKAIDNIIYLKEAIEEVEKENG